jgi:hypothetical protein
MSSDVILSCRRVSLNPWAGHDLASSKEFFRSMTVARLKKANPKCPVTLTTHSRAAPPAITVK